MERQPQNPEFRNNPENFHPWSSDAEFSSVLSCSSQFSVVNCSEL